jgi:hypothetical protein
MKTACNKTMSPNFNKKEVLEILCLKKIIASKAPIVPPKKETAKAYFQKFSAGVFCFSLVGSINNKGKKIDGC